MSNNGGCPQTATPILPMLPRTNVGVGVIGVSTARTTAQVVTAAPRSNKLPQRHGLVTYVPEMITICGAKTPIAMAPSSNQPQ